MQGAGAPLYETLGAAFPAGLFDEGLEATIKHRVRRRLRDIGYRVVFPPDEPWQNVIELFAVAGLERMHRGYGQNPWFWVAAWPTIFGAAAVDFWPEVGTPTERRMIAADAAAAHLEAILIRVALSDSDAVGALPACAIKGLRAIGQSTLPALPTAGVESADFTLPKTGVCASTPYFARDTPTPSASVQLPTSEVNSVPAPAPPADPVANWTLPPLPGQFAAPVAQVEPPLPPGADAGLA